MVDAWNEYIASRTILLENVGHFWCPDITGLEQFADKTLIWHDPVNAKFCKHELIEMVWSLEYGCNTSNDFAYIEETSLGFVGISLFQKHNYAYRRNTALCIKKQYFNKNSSDIFKIAFLNHPFGTVIPHPFAQEAPKLPAVPFANITQMIVIDKHFDQVSEDELNNAIRYLQNSFNTIPNAQILQAARLAANWASARSDPLMLKENCVEK